MLMLPLLAGCERSATLNPGDLVDPHEVEPPLLACSELLPPKPLVPPVCDHSGELSPAFSWGHVRYVGIGGNNLTEAATVLLPDDGVVVVGDGGSSYDYAFAYFDLGGELLGRYYSDWGGSDFPTSAAVLGDTVIAVGWSEVLNGNVETITSPQAAYRYGQFPADPALSFSAPLTSDQGYPAILARPDGLLLEAQGRVLGLRTPEGALLVKTLARGSIYDLASYLDGGIVAAEHGGIERFHADLTRDETFGEHGFVALSPSDDVRTVTVDGQCGVVARVSNASPEPLIRLRRDGSQDDDFAARAAGALWYFTDLATDWKGRVVALGGTQNSSDVGDVARFELDGHPDRTFGHHGVAALPVTVPSGHIVFQRDGTIVLGVALTPPDLNTNIAFDFGAMGVCP
jgi:hypothetical protein